MNTLSIIVIVLAVCYSIFLGWTVKSYKSELKKKFKADLDTFRENQGVKMIVKDIHIEELKDKIKYQKRAFAQYVEDSISEREKLHYQINQLTKTELDGM